MVSDVASTLLQAPSSRSLALVALEIEVIDAVTELLLARASRDELDALEDWKRRLVQLRGSVRQKPQNTSELPAASKSSNTANSSLQEVRNADKEIVGKESVPRGNTTPPSSLDPHFTKGVSSAKALTEAAIRIYSAHDWTERTGSASVDQLTAEVNHLYKSTRITAIGEETRTQVIAQVQDAFHREPWDWIDWRHWKLLPFGSSVSKFGTSKADLDICMRINPHFGTVSEVMAAERNAPRLRGYQ